MSKTLKDWLPTNNNTHMKVNRLDINTVPGNIELGKYLYMSNLCNKCQIQGSTIYFSVFESSYYWKYTILIIKKLDILHITKTRLFSGITEVNCSSIEWERSFEREIVPENSWINLNNKEMRSLSLILDPRVNLIEIELTVKLAKISNRRFGVLSAQHCITFVFLRWAVFLSVFVNVCLHMSVCTLISQVCCSNSELWKGQTVTFVCDSGLKWDMMWAAQNGLHSHTNTQSQAYARLGCHCGFDPCFLTPHYWERSKLKSSLFCSSCTFRSFFPPTPLPLTLARGHPPVDGTIPAAFDTESALQPATICWFCNKLKLKSHLSLSLLHCCDLNWLQRSKAS